MPEELNRAVLSNQEGWRSTYRSKQIHEDAILSWEQSQGIWMPRRTQNQSKDREGLYPGLSHHCRSSDATQGNHHEDEAGSYPWTAAGCPSRQGSGYYWQIPEPSDWNCKPLGLWFSIYRRTRIVSFATLFEQFFFTPKFTIPFLFCSILFLDLLKMHCKNANASCVYSWLNYEWTSLGLNIGSNNLCFDAKSMLLVSPKGRFCFIFLVQHYMEISSFVYFCCQ